MRGGGGGDDDCAKRKEASESRQDNEDMITASLIIHSPTIEPYYLITDLSFRVKAEYSCSDSAAAIIRLD